jgi:hypothetical protein
MDNIIPDVRMGEHFMGDELAIAKALSIKVKGARHAADCHGGGDQRQQSDLLHRT